MNLMSARNFSLLLIILALLVAASSGAYYYGYQQGSTLSQTPKTASGLKLEPSSIVKVQQATAIGDMVSKDTTSITLKGDDGKQANFKLAQDFVVYPQISSASAALQPSHEIGAIPSGKVVVNLQLQDNAYLVKSISTLVTNFPFNR